MTGDLTTVIKTARKHPLAQCEVCPLAKANCVPTSGPINAKIAFVSRSPGKHDVRLGKPFAGPSGKVLDHLLKKHGVDRRDILTTNVVLCETDDPPTQAIQACRTRLEAEIANAALVIAGGAEAVSTLTKYKSVTRARGFDHTRTTAAGSNQRVVATNNPAAVLRDSDKFPDMVRDFRLALDPIPPPTFPGVEIINDPIRARDALRKWLKATFESPVATDLEWRSSNDEFVCAGFAKRATRAVVFGYGAIRDGETRRLLEAFYRRDDVRFVWHNGKSDTKILAKSGIIARVDEDTFLQSLALDERPGVHSLEYLLMSEFGWPDYEPQEVKDFKKDGELTPEREHQLYTYNGWDAAGTLLLYNLFSDKITSGGFVQVYKERLIPVAEALKQVELNGFRYDAEAAMNLWEAEVAPRLWRLSDAMQTIAGRQLLNPNSNPQMHAVYYDVFGLKHNLRNTGIKKLESSTGAEVRKEILEGRFRCKHGQKDALVEFARLHASFAAIDKQRGTYIEGLIKRVAPDGKLYSTFNPGGAVTGRPSSKDPNFQNVTREGKEGIRSIRTLFLPSPGCTLVSADYSQAELRTCAVVSGDTNLLAIYRDSSRSLHKERATAFYGANYTKEEYVRSKNINFGVTYGQSAFAFAQMYHIDEREAQDYIDSWWAEFPDLKKWTEQIKQQVLTEGVVTSPFGFKRRFHLITEENKGDVLREGVNFIPQNVAAWLTLHSLADLVRRGVRIVTTVHDSIVADVPNREVGRVARRMKEVMETQSLKQLNWTEIPFTVDVSVGDNWANMEEIVV